MGGIALDFQRFLSRGNGEIKEQGKMWKNKKGREEEEEKQK